MSIMPDISDVARRQLNLIFLLDSSGSMNGEKIASLNYALRNAIPALREVAEEHSEVEVFLRAIRFSDGANWHVEARSAAEFDWADLTAGGGTDLGAAFNLVAEELTPEKLKGRQLPPIIVLVSDGQPTDRYEDGLKKLISAPYGAKAIRVAIAIGSDADLRVMEKFIGDKDRRPLRAGNSNDLVRYIKWVSTSAVAQMSQNRGGSLALSMPEDSSSMVW